MLTRQGVSFHPGSPLSGCPAARALSRCFPGAGQGRFPKRALSAVQRDRKSTRLNSSHGYISYAVFCLKKKKKKKK